MLQHVISYLEKAPGGYLLAARVAPLMKHMMTSCRYGVQFSAD